MWKLPNYIYQVLNEIFHSSSQNIFTNRITCSTKTQKGRKLLIFFFWLRSQLLFFRLFMRCLNLTFSNISFISCKFLFGIENIFPFSPYIYIAFWTSFSRYNINNICTRFATLPGNTINWFFKEWYFFLPESNSAIHSLYVSEWLVYRYLQLTHIHSIVGINSLHFLHDF